MAEERSVSDVFQDILRNLQEMVRSEIRLAKVEIRGEVKQAGSSAVWIAAGGVAAMSASIFLLWTLAYALATRMSMWAATLIVGPGRPAIEGSSALPIISGRLRALIRCRVTLPITRIILACGLLSKM